jgi:hypothetical protein
MADSKSPSGPFADNSSPSMEAFPRSESVRPVHQPIVDDPIFEIIPRSALQPVQAGRYYREDRIRDAVKSGEAVPVHVLMQEANKGCAVKIDHGTLQKHLSNFNKRQAQSGENMRLMSTTHYRLYPVDEVAYLPKGGKRHK